MDGLSLQTQQFSPKETRSFGGVRVPWEVQGYEEDFAQSEQGGVFDLSPWRTFEVSGPDARDYLNRLSTRDFRSPSPDQLWTVGFLTGKAQVVALGRVEAWDPQRYLLSFPPEQGEAALAHLNQFHFAENLAIRDVSDRWTWLGVWSPNAEVPEGRTDLAQQARGWGDAFDPHLQWVRVETPLASQWVASTGLAWLGHRLFEYFRLKAGAADVGRGLAPGGLVLEADLGDLISRAKGCYPGQEVVERVFTYGKVNQQLKPVRVESSLSETEVPRPLEGAGKKAGELVCWMREPGSLRQGRGLALVKRAFWDTKENLSQANDLTVHLVS